MSMPLLFLLLAPLIVYMAVEYFKGFRAGIYAAFVTCGFVLGGTYVLTGDIDGFVIGETLLIVIMGLISLMMNNEHYFKFQPMVLGLIYSGLFAYFQIFDQPLLLRFIPHMEKLVAAAETVEAGEGLEPLTPAAENPLLQMLRDPQTRVSLGKMSFACIWLFLGHAAVMGYAALRLSTQAWVAWRLALYPALFFLVILIRLSSAM